MESTSGAAVENDASAVAWWVLVGAGSGAIAGFLIGGIGGRLAMLLLRLTSPDLVIGMSSDDGFEIGVFSTDTFNLLAAMTFVGAANGLLYAALRSAVPRRLRLLLWTLLAAAAGGASFVHEDGIDFTVLEPAALAVVLFVALPALAAALVVVLVERWVDVEPRDDRRLVGVLLVAAVASTLALVLAAVVGAVAVVARRAGAVELLRPVSRIVVPLVLIAVTLVAAVNLITEASRII
jgi:predicted neutral ceramidase superfamily lipid hydrolase